MAITRAQMEDMVETWQARLHLDNWKITFKWDEPLDPDDAWAQVESSKHFDDTPIRFASNFAKWDIDTANKVIVHELLHLRNRDLEEATMALKEHVAPTTWALYVDRLTHEHEGFIDWVASKLVDYAGHA